MKFINLLPLRVKIYAYRIDKLDLIGSIAGNGSSLTASKTITGMVFQTKDEIHVTYSPSGESGPEYEILQPITLVEDAKEIRIGDVVYNENTNTLVQRSHSDISGIRFHNTITIPVKIYYEDIPLAYVNPNDGTDVNSGSPSSVYVNNDTNGFNIGDKLVFTLVFNKKEIKWCTITISDNYMSDVHLGVINQHITRPIQDYYSYRVGGPNINGLKYLMDNKAYQSVH